MNSTSCTTFLTSCIQALGKGEESVEVQRFTLALKLAAHLGSMCFEYVEGPEAINGNQVLNCVFGAANGKSGYWQEAVVRNSWVSGLFCVAQNPLGFKWVIKQGKSLS